MTDRRAQFNPAVFQHDPAATYPWQAFGRVTIAMLTWNRRELTERCIEAIYRHAGMPFELLVVDNASTDGTVEMLEAIAAAQGNLRLHRNPENVGRLRGIQQVRDILPPDGLVLYLDNDIEFLSSLFLVHLQKAFHAVRLATGKPDAVFGIRLVNCEEHGFRHAADVRRLAIPSAENGAPRTGFAAVNKDRAPPEHRFDEQVLLGVSDFIIGGCWACPVHLLRSVPFETHFPGFIGGDDAIASAHWASLGVPMGYLENGIVARHLDWPYSEEKIQLYTQLAQQRAVTDFSYVLWKIRRFFQ
ncbi:glycosyltransferase family 2 protein [Falsiroseomonas oryzae]|uniref:glycosyltransferase family 2 protein n=1 Tax=Falsiroseomonas oryzae TaxID=2766473 RepID=UPI0022EA3AD4|nr:glycosyltransferase family 2 protein [Roseomonas sp. MO-31]